MPRQQYFFLFLQVPFIPLILGKPHLSAFWVLARLLENYADKISRWKLLGFLCTFLIPTLLVVIFANCFLPNMLVELKIHCPTNIVDFPYDDFCHNSVVRNGTRWSGSLQKIKGLHGFFSLKTILHRNENSSNFEKGKNLQN